MVHLARHVTFGLLENTLCQNVQIKANVPTQK